MEILSSVQHDAFRAGQIPVVEEFADGTWSVPMQLPGRFPGGVQSYSYAYVLDDFSGGFHVIDPGWDLEENLRRWEEFFSRVGRGFSDVATVTATHLHHDHLGLAGEFARRSGAPLLMHESEASVLDEAARSLAEGDLVEANRVSRVYAAMTRERLEALGVPEDRWQELLWIPEAPAFPVPNRRVQDGDRLPIPARELEVLWTPGHTGGHMCLVEQNAGVIFTADHVLPGINSGLGLGGESPTNPIADYIAALERLTLFEPFVVAPGHEYRFRGLAERAEVLREHHLKRAREVGAAMDRTANVWEIAQQVTWSDGFENLRSYRLGSALSQVAMHMEYVAGT